MFIHWVWYRSTPSFKSALDGRGCSTPRPGRFTPGNVTLYQLHGKLGGSKVPSGQAQKSSPPQEFDPRSAQSVERRYTVLAILAIDIDTIQCFRSVLVTRGNSLLTVISNPSGLLGLSLWTLSLINPLLKKSGTLNEVWWSWWPKFMSDSAITEDVLKESSCCFCRMDSRAFFSNCRSRSFCSGRAMNWGKRFA
jgi:hypothetical protein